MCLSKPVKSDRQSTSLQYYIIYYSCETFYCTDICFSTFTDQNITKLVMEQHALKNVNNCSNANVYSYLETSGVESYDLYLNVVHFFNTSVN